MGFPMAGHLAGRFETRVWNRTASVSAAHARRYGSRACADLLEAAQAEVIVTCLPTSQEVAEVLGMMEGRLSAGQLVIDCTSGDPQRSQEIASGLAERGVGFVDAPVSGGTAGASSGRLSVMAGGSPEDFGRAVQVLESFAAKIVHVGPVGAGHAVKAVNNMLLAVALWSAGEGLSALAAAGVDLGRALEVINASSGRSNATENLVGQRVLSREFPLTFKLGLLSKDAGIALDLARRQGLASPLFAAADAMLRVAKQQLGPDVDHSAALQVLESWSGITLR
jgi:3-hydroxyisobutyrate dehydrogenase